MGLSASLVARIPPKVRRVVLARDRRCIASLLWAHQCRDAGGSVHPPDDLRRLELDHVREDSMMGVTAPSVPEHLVALCRYAHQTSHWATANRPVLRAYLADPSAVHDRVALAALRRLAMVAESDWSGKI